MGDVLVARGGQEPEVQARPIPGYEPVSAIEAAQQAAETTMRRVRRPIQCVAAGGAALILADDATMWLLIEPGPDKYEWIAAPPLPQE